MFAITKRKMGEKITVLALDPPSHGASWRKAVQKQVFLWLPSQVEVLSPGLPLIEKKGEGQTQDKGEPLQGVPGGP